MDWEYVNSNDSRKCCSSKCPSTNHADLRLAGETNPDNHPSNGLGEIPDPRQPWKDSGLLEDDSRPYLDPILDIATGALVLWLSWLDDPFTLILRGLGFVIVLHGLFAIFKKARRYFNL